MLFINCNYVDRMASVFSISKISFNSFVYQCRLLITLANSLDPDQARRIIAPDLGPNSDIQMVFQKEFFQNVNFEKNQQKTKKRETLPNMQ